MRAITRNLLIIGIVMTVHMVLICLLAQGFMQVHTPPQVITVTLHASLTHNISPARKETPLAQSAVANSEVLPPAPHVAREPKPPRPVPRREPSVPQPRVASAPTPAPITPTETTKAAQSSPQTQPTSEQGSGELSSQTSQAATSADSPSSTQNTAGATRAVAGEAGAGGAVVAPSHNAAYLRNAQPVYPPMSRRLGEEGKVVLRTLVSSKGTALNVEIKSSSGHKRLDQAALDAVKRWRFIPAQKEGAPVDMWHDVPIHFSLKNS